MVALESGLDREHVMAELPRRGVATAGYVPCVHLLTYMRDRYGFREGLCPVAEDVSSRTLALPFHTRLEAEHQERVVESLTAALARR